MKILLFLLFPILVFADPNTDIINLGSHDFNIRVIAKNNLLRNKDATTVLSALYSNLNHNDLEIAQASNEIFYTYVERTDITYFLTPDTDYLYQFKKSVLLNACSNIYPGIENREFKTIGREVRLTLHHLKLYRKTWAADLALELWDRFENDVQFKFLACAVLADVAKYKFGKYKDFLIYLLITDKYVCYNELPVIAAVADVKHIDSLTMLLFVYLFKCTFLESLYTPRLAWWRSSPETLAQTYVDAIKTFPKEQIIPLLFSLSMLSSDPAIQSKIKILLE